MHMSFNSASPELSDLEVERGALGTHADHLMSHEAFLNPEHRLHSRVVGEVQSAFYAMFGDKPVVGGQPFDVMSFQTGSAHPGEPRT